jgi:hypothetical protein
MPSEGQPECDLPDSIAGVLRRLHARRLPKTCRRRHVSRGRSEVQSIEEIRDGDLEASANPTVERKSLGEPIVERERAGAFEHPDAGVADPAGVGSGRCEGVDVPPGIRGWIPRFAIGES